jgi:hypothetical protein
VGFNSLLSERQFDDKKNGIVDNDYVILNSQQDVCDMKSKKYQFLDTLHRFLLESITTTNLYY